MHPRRLKTPRVGHHKPHHRKIFLRYLRSPGLLRGLRAKSALAIAAILLTRLPARVRTRIGARAAMEGTRASTPCPGEKLACQIRIIAVMSASENVQTYCHA